MDLISIVITVVAGAVGLAVALLLHFIDDAGEKLMGWFFRLVGLQSKRGPLTAEAVVDGERTVLRLVNQGKYTLRLLTVEGRDRRGEHKFPVPYLSEEEFRTSPSDEQARKQFSKVALGHGEVKTVFLKTSELATLDCQAIAILDSSGRAWPVDGYHVGNH